MDFLEEINAKYSAMEAEVDNKLDKICREEEKYKKLEERHEKNSNSIKNQRKVLSYEDAVVRNANLLKSLEVAKARLRSRSTFSPVEKILEQAIANYKTDLMASKSSTATIWTARSANLRNNEN